MHSRHNWAWALFIDNRAAVYDISIRIDSMDATDMSAIKLHLTQKGDSVWDGSDVCHRTCRSRGQAFVYITGGLQGHRASTFWAHCQKGHAIRAAVDSGKA